MSWGFASEGAPIEVDSRFPARWQICVRAQDAGSVVQVCGDLGACPVGRIPGPLLAYRGAVIGGRGPPGKAPNVRWRVENPDKLALCCATSATISQKMSRLTSRIDAITEMRPEGGDSPWRGGHHGLDSAWGHPLPNQLYVRWAGQDEWVAVLLHPAH